MNRKKKKRSTKLKYSLLLSFFVPTILFVCITTTFAGHDPLQGFEGPAFTDPAQVTEMPEVWRERTIQHDTSAGEVDLVITLDQHLYPVFLPVIQEYSKAHNLNIHVNEGTCGISAGMLSQKTADIGGFCCVPGVTNRLPGLKFHTAGISPLSLLVHPDNPIENITLDEARKIFMGETHRWSELEREDREMGPNMPVQPVTRLHCKLRGGHWRLLLGNEDLFGTNIQEVGSIPDMMYRVASNKGAIGYEVLWNLIRYKDKGKVKALKINGYSPYEPDHIISGKYPLYRVYGLTTWEDAHLSNPEAQKIVRYLLKHSERLEKEHNIISADKLRNAGWKFRDTELIGEPGQ